MEIKQHKQQRIKFITLQAATVTFATLIGIAVSKYMHHKLPEIVSYEYLVVLCAVFILLVILGVLLFEKNVRVEVSDKKINIISSRVSHEFLKENVVITRPDWFLYRWSFCSNNQQKYVLPVLSLTREQNKQLKHCLGQYAYI